MKTVKITITGDILAVDYCSQSLIDEENDFLSQYYLTCGWDKVTGLFVDDSDENVVKSKGKYVKTKEYFHDLWSEESDHPLPVECHARVYNRESLDYVIRLEDNEEFDIKKVQLIKSDYEISEFPYYILAEKILYDGKEIAADDDYVEYCPDEKMYSEFVVEEFVE